MHLLNLRLFGTAVVLPPFKADQILNTVYIEQRVDRIDLGVSGSLCVLFILLHSLAGQKTNPVPSALEPLRP